MAPYEGSAGNVLYEYKGGRIDDDKLGFTLFGNGTEDEGSPSAVNGINGVTEFATGNVLNNSVGLATPRGFRPGIKENGRLRDASGPLTTKMRLGFPARDDMYFFFGILDEDPGVSRTVEEILTAVAAGTITSVESDFAGFYYNSDFTASADQWRAVAVNSGGGNKKGSESPVLTDRKVEAATTYMNQTSVLSPTLSIEVVYDGTVEFYVNGDIVRRVFEGVNPETSYCQLFVLQTDEAVAKKVGVDYFCAEYARYYGPIFA